MSDNQSSESSQAQVRRAVRKELRSLVGDIVWTLLSGLAILLGLQLLQFASLSSGIAVVGFAGAGMVVLGCSLYLLYLIHWRHR
jgi:membrane-bound ClpP family serine protease